MRYHVQDDSLYYGEKLIGPADTMYVDGNQDVARGLTEGVRKLPWGDYVFVCKNGLIAGVEEKRIPDLYTSLSNRRAQKQLANLMETVDVPVLGLRLEKLWEFRMGLENLSDTLGFPHLGFPKVQSELLKWSMHGLILILPADPEEVMCSLSRLRNTLQPGRHLASIFGYNGTPKIKEVDGFERAMRSVEGVGKSAAAKLREHFDGSVRAAFSAEPEEWKKAGCHKRIVNNFEVLIG